MKEILIALISLTVFLAIVQCGGDSTGPSQGNPCEYISYSIGNRWDYSFSSQITWSSKDSTCTLDGTQYTIVQDIVTHPGNGQLLYKLEWSRTAYWYSGSACIDTTYQGGEWYESITSDAVYGYTDINDMNPETKLQLPPQVGDSWNSSDSIWAYSVLSLTDAVSVPSGSYSDCLKLQQRASSIYENRDVWFATTPHNWIKVTGERDISGYSQEEWTIEMTSFTAKGSAYDPHTPNHEMVEGIPLDGCGSLLN